MSGNVHQDDEDKLKATVTQAEKDRTVTGAVTANAGTNLNTSGLAITNPETDDNNIPAGEIRETPIALLYAYDENLGAWNRLYTRGGTSGLYVHALQPTAANLKATVTQAAKDRTVTNATASNLKAEVTQAAIARTITGTATVTQIPLSTMLSSAITLTSADTDYLLPASEQSGRSILVIYNDSDTTVYIGGNGVTTAAGLHLASTKYMVVPASANVYAVCGSAGKTLRLSECK